MRRLWRRGRGHGGTGGEGRRGAGPAAVRGVRGIAAALASIVDVVVGVVCVLLVLGILLVVLGANDDNAVVGAIIDAAEFLAGPFADVFERDDRKEEVAINWGIAVVVYFVLGRLVASLLRRGRR
jgi:hypothetical protein